MNPLYGMRPAWRPLLAAALFALLAVAAGLPAPEQAVAAPANDALGDATAINAVPFTDGPLSTTDATSETGEDEPCGSIGATVWYKYTHPEGEQNATLVADTFGSDFDTVLAVYESDSSSATFLTLDPIGCSDNVGVDFEDPSSRLVFEVKAAATYYFQVGGYQGATGNLFFNLADDASAGPASFKFRPTPGFSITQSNRSAVGDLTWDWTIPEPDPFHVYGTNFVPPGGVARDEDIPDGAVVGDVDLDVTVGTHNNACNTPVSLPAANLLDATTDIDPPWVDNPFAYSERADLPDGILRYPKELALRYPGQKPIARYMTVYENGGGFLHIVLFDRGKTYQMVGIPTGGPQFPSGGTICSPFASTITFFGQSRDNRLTHGCSNTTDDDGDGFINDGCPAVGLSESGYQCNNETDDEDNDPVKEDVQRDGVYNDGCPAVEDPETPLSEPPESGYVVRRNPDSGGKHFFNFFLRGWYDADGDGVDNGLDPCPFTVDAGPHHADPDWDPRSPLNPATDTDQDGIPDSCDPTPLENTGAGDHDGDGVPTLASGFPTMNRQDNCPLVYNPQQMDWGKDGRDLPGTEAESPVSHHEADGIGNECDGATGVADVGTTGTVLTDADPDTGAFPPDNALEGSTVIYVSGPAAAPRGQQPQKRTVIANTADTITVNSPFDLDPAGGGLSGHRYVLDNTKLTPTGVYREVTMPGTLVVTPTITVDSSADSDQRDGAVTLREALRLATGDLTYGSLDPREKDNVRGDRTRGDFPGAASAETIIFHPGVFPATSPATIALGSALPALSTDGDAIDGYGSGVVVDGGSRAFDCFSVSGNGNTIKGLALITGCANGIHITGANNTVGGTPFGELGIQCLIDNVQDNDGDGLVNDGCPTVGLPEVLCNDTEDNDTDNVVNDGCRAVGEGNIIAFNDGDGVRVQRAAATGNAATGNIVRGNSIHSNGLKGIKLAGGNSNLARPEITTVAGDPSVPGAAWTVRGTTCSGCAVELFSDSAEEGRVFEGVAFTVGTTWTFVGELSGPYITATATDAGGNTSEFSAPVLLATPLALEGLRAAETGGLFGPDFDLDISSPPTGTQGTSVFRDTIVNSTTTTEGIFLFFAGDPQPLRDVALSNQVAPGGGTFAGFGAPVINDDRKIVAAARLSDGREGLFLFFAGSPCPGGTVATSAGYCAQLIADTSLFFAGLFFAGGPANGSPETGSQCTNRIDDDGDTVANDGCPVVEPAINNQGSIAARVALNEEPDREALYLFFAGLFFAGSGTTQCPANTVVTAPDWCGQALGAAGDPIPDNDPDTNLFFAGSPGSPSFSQPAINDDGVVAARANFSILGNPDPKEGLFLFFAGSAAIVAEGGQDPGLFFAGAPNFSAPDINDGRYVVASASFNDGTTTKEGVFLFFAGLFFAGSSTTECPEEAVVSAPGWCALQLAVADDETGPGTNLFFAGAPDFGPPAINDNGLVTARGRLKDPTREGLFLFFAGLFFAGGPYAQAVALEGDVAATSPQCTGNGTYGIPPERAATEEHVFPFYDMNNGSQVVFVANVTGSSCSQGVFLASLDSEKPNGDGVIDYADNCPAAFNTDQRDDDDDGVGNACDDYVSAIVPPGGIASTGISSGVSATDPIKTSVTVPDGGAVTIRELWVTLAPPFFGQEVQITAPAASASTPIRLDFWIDSSQIPLGENKDTILIFRESAAIAGCQDGSGAAAPNPCISGRGLTGDDIRITVLTSSASNWNFGVPDRDGDGVPYGLDNCPNWPNPAQNLPPWPVPADDPDCDGFSTTDENHVGTGALVHCGVNAWPPDMNDDGFVDTRDIAELTGRFSLAVPPEDPRYDIRPSGFVDTGDISRMTNVFGLSCAP